MAIQIPYTDSQDNDYPNAYVRIDELYTNFAEGKATMQVSIYKNKAATTKGKKPVDTKIFDFQSNPEAGPVYESVFGQALYDASKTDPRKLGYIWLKTNSIFSSGLDV